MRPSRATIEAVFIHIFEDFAQGSLFARLKHLTRTHTICDAELLSYYMYVLLYDCIISFPNSICGLHIFHIRSSSDRGIWSLRQHVTAAYWKGVSTGDGYCYLYPCAEVHKSAAAGLQYYFSRAWFLLVYMYLFDMHKYIYMCEYIRTNIINNFQTQTPFVAF